MSHTKGPWRVGYESESSRSTEMLVRADEVDGQPWVAICRSNFGDIPIEANAQLISAAPELLECLQWWVERLETPGTMSESEATAIMTEALMKARAAIAKATGG